MHHKALVALIRGKRIQAGKTGKMLEELDGDAGGNITQAGGFIPFDSATCEYLSLKQGLMMALMIDCGEVN